MRRKRKNMDINCLFGRDENEKPLDNIVSDGGFVGIFRTIACIGDSLASGEFEAKSVNDGTNIYIDRFEYSWGQYIARMSGTTVYNFSRGGMTAREYMAGFANSMGYWQKRLAANAYIVALGVNDVLNRRHEIGGPEDICREDYRQNKDTFFGNYAAIIQRYRAIAPDAPFFLLTTPNADDAEERAELRRKLAEAVRRIAECFDNCYVIDLYEYAPRIDPEFRRKFNLTGHLNPAGYLLVGKLVCSYIDYIVRHNFEKFKTVGLMDFDYTLTVSP